MTLAAPAGRPILPAPAGGWRSRLVRIVLGLVVGLEVVWIAYALAASIGSPSFGLDYRWHVDAARRLVETGTPYLAWQLAGPYEIANGAILYPPIAFVLFVPFLVVPAPLWWILPIGITVGAMTRHRPPAWTWVVTLSLFGLEKSLNVYVFGNPTMWLVAAVAAGTILGWPFALVLAKPTFTPLALLGMPRRAWWGALGLMVLVSLPFARVWADWLLVVRNSDVTLAYNLPTVPLAVAPLIPWLAADPAMASRALRRVRARAGAAM